MTPITSRIVHGLLVVGLMSIPVCAASPPASRPTTQKLPRDQWGAPLVEVKHDGALWTIAGQKQRVTFNRNDFSVQVQAGSAAWKMVGSNPEELRLKVNDQEYSQGLLDASTIDVTPYDTGYKTGIKIVLSGFPHAEHVRLFLTLALEGKDEDLAFDVAAEEIGGTVHQLDWPTALDGREVDCTLLPNHRGVLLPRDWDKPYFPIRSTEMGGNPKASDTSEVQSNVIESWSMSWWGWQKGPSAAMVIIETPDDAAYQFDHPAGGPTTIGPRWRESLGALRYPRAGRMCFVEKGNYVDLAKRYRKHVQDRGQFVSLNEKIARRPIVKELIGTPAVRVGILTNIQPDSLRWSTTEPTKNYRMTTFDDRAKQLRSWKEKGIDRLNVCLTGWPCQGYDRQHPDELPPAPIARGWEGMKRLADTCKELGYLFGLHDQYRDYYTDAPSYDPQFAIQEEDDKLPAKSFPGSRFGQWKQGRIPFMNNWDGGTMAYMNNRLMPGHLIKNYTWLFDHGIHPDGTYLDVFGYVPPDQDFNPEHPTTRTDAINARIACFTWSRQNIGFIGTEAGCDWTVPYADMTSALRANKAVPVPLFNLVYHDAIIVPYDASDLRGYLNGGLPQGFRGGEFTDADLQKIRRMASLHKRLALTEMTKHEFLGENYRKERATFSDGTTVTVSWDNNDVDIQPPL